jgi:hypothetical protein
VNRRGFLSGTVGAAVAAALPPLPVPAAPLVLIGMDPAGDQDMTVISIGWINKRAAAVGRLDRFRWGKQQYAPVTYWAEETGKWL